MSVTPAIGQTKRKGQKNMRIDFITWLVFWLIAPVRHVKHLWWKYAGEGRNMYSPRTWKGYIKFAGKRHNFRVADVNDVIRELKQVRKYWYKY